MENQTNLELNEQAIDALRESAKWSLFLSIMGFIGIGFMIIAAIFMGSVMSMLPNDNSPFGAMKGFISIIYVVLAALYFPPTYYLFKYSSDIKNGLISRSSNAVSEALISLKKHHKYLGISLIVIIALYVIGIFAMVVFFASSARV
jgi:hypothetical protein